jgi:hypothetical protein
MRKGQSYVDAQREYTEFIAERFRELLSDKSDKDIDSEFYIRIESQIASEAEGVAAHLKNKYHLTSKQALPGALQVYQTITRLISYTARFERAMNC